MTEVEYFAIYRNDAMVNFKGNTDTKHNQGMIIVPDIVLTHLYSTFFFITMGLFLNFSISAGLLNWRTSFFSGGKVGDTSSSARTVTWMKMRSRSDSSVTEASVYFGAACIHVCQCTRSNS
jgi:hypothetical protein